MRTMRLQGWGMMLVAAAAACGEAVAPAVSSRDLEFAVPAGAHAVGDLTQEAVESPYADRTVAEAATVDGGETPIPILEDYFLKGWFEGSVFVFEYGLIGWGTGYSIRPTVHIVGPDGQTLYSKAGLGISEDFMLPMTMRPTGRDKVNIGIRCGAQATLAANFEIRVSIQIFGTIRFWNTVRTASDLSYQPACPPPPPVPSEGGGGGGGDEDALWLCYYDVWFNRNGDVVLVEEVACYKLANFQ